jgi:hypothetical protein
MKYCLLVNSYKYDNDMTLWGYIPKKKKKKKIVQDELRNKFCTQTQQSNYNNRAIDL